MKESIFYILAIIFGIIVFNQNDNDLYHGIGMMFFGSGIFGMFILLISKRI